MTPEIAAQPLELPGHAHVYSGKVRELYAPLEPGTGRPREDQLLLVASDRISAFDHVLDSEIPDKGKVLTQLSLWWFEQLADILPNHVISSDVPDAVAGRAVLVRRLDMVPVECIGRAYLTGSGLADYRESGSVCGVPLPAGLQDGSELPEPIFTPTTKASEGHDEPITFDDVVRQEGREVAERLRELTLEIYTRGAAYAAGRGVIIADTKVEFGWDGEVLTLGDEVLTSDSSRYWPAAEWEPGHAQPSFDKQFVRDWSTSTGWNKEYPGPEIPADIVAATREKYREAYELITGSQWAGTRP
jgi:phosphoribosylaminoimidazole-succinocarboxamide synthase